MKSPPPQAGVQNGLNLGEHDGRFYAEHKAPFEQLTPQTLDLTEED
jgi:hypothetical protein